MKLLVFSVFAACFGCLNSWAGYTGFTGPLDASNHTQQGQPGFTNFNANETLEQSGFVQLYHEDLNKTLAANLPVDAVISGAITMTQGSGGTSGSIASGTAIDSWYFHFDPAVTQDLTNISVTFDADILGVIHSTGTLNSTDATLTATTCAGGCTFISGARGTLEAFDTLSVSSDRRTITINQIRTLSVGGNNYSDDFRVITEGTTTVPIILKSFKVMAEEKAVQVDWSTASEAGVVGFFVEEWHLEKWVALNSQLIPARGIDSVTPQAYSYQLEARGRGPYRLVEVDYRGARHNHGPFEMGTDYGESVLPSVIPWSKIRQEHDAKASVRRLQREAEVRRNLANLAAATDRGSALGFRVAKLSVIEDGIHRVTFEDLLAAGIDLAGVSGDELALVTGDEPVSRHLMGLDAENRFGPGSVIEFYGTRKVSQYTRCRAYYLQLDPQLAVNMKVQMAPPVGPFTSSYWESNVFEEQRAYSVSSPNGDPWYQEALLTFDTPSTWDFEIEVDHLVANSKATLLIGLWGVTNWPEQPDHHVQIDLNGNRVSDILFDGLSEQSVQIDLQAGSLREGVNQITIRLPGDTGVAYDLVNLDRFELGYERQLRARNGTLSFDARSQALQVTNLPSNDVIVYRLAKGKATRLNGIQVSQQGTGFTATFAGSREAARYVITVPIAANRPAIEPARPINQSLTKKSSYLVLSHPDFLNDLAHFVSVKTEQGYSVSLVDVEDIYDQFGFGSIDPESIRDYIAFAARELGTQYVLLVGGDTYDYFDYLNLGSLSFVPTIYTPTHPVVSFTPSDPLLVDINRDRLPDLPIGRFPARSSEELVAMIEKNLAYDGSTHTAIFAADRGFAGDGSSLAETLPNYWQVSEAYLDQMSLTVARDHLLLSMNEGVDLVGYFGHSGLTDWTFEGLFGSSDARSLTNVDQPMVVLQWGCWNTYHVHPRYHTLAHALMIEGNRGAAAVVGSSTLTQTRSDRAVGATMLHLALRPLVTIGDAIQEAKTELARTDPDMLDVILGWTLLGDPTLVIEP